MLSDVEASSSESSKHNKKVKFQLEVSESSSSSISLTDFERSAPLEHIKRYTNDVKYV